MDLHDFLRDIIFPQLEQHGGIAREVWIGPELHPDLPNYPDRALLGSIRGTDFHLDRSLPGKLVKAEVGGVVKEISLKGDLV